MAQATGYVGERVRWLGPPQTGFVTDAYRAALVAGERRPPAAGETLSLATGEYGTVTELLRVDDAGYHTCVIRFAGGHEIEVVLPAPTLVEFVDHTTATAPARPGRRYATAPASLRTRIGQLTHGFLRAVRLTSDPG